MSARVQPNATEHRRRSRVPATQTSPFALATGDGDRSARDDDSLPRQENLTANRAGDRRSTAPPLEPLAYTINDTVKVSGLGRSSIYKLIGEGKLRSVLVAGRRLIPADELRALLRGAE